MPEILLEVNGLGVTWCSPQGERPMVSQVDFSLKPGCGLTLLGETGCGKTLVAQAIMGLLPPEMRAGGEARFRGLDLLAASSRQCRALWGRSIFLFPQEPLAALTPSLRARSQLAEVYRWLHKLPGPRAIQEADQTLAGLGLGQSGGLYPCQLSGGMRQRLAAAITAAEPAELIICDETQQGLGSDTVR